MDTAPHPLAQQLAEVDYLLSNPTRGRLNHLVPTMIFIALSITAEVRHG